MKKIRKVLEFILALLNFLFHFKPVPKSPSAKGRQAFFICLLNKPEFIQQLFLLQPVLLQQELLFQQQL